MEIISFKEFKEKHYKRETIIGKRMNRLLSLVDKGYSLFTDIEIERGVNAKQTIKKCITNLSLPDNISIVYYKAKNEFGIEGLVLYIKTMEEKNKEDE